ncbi:MAG: type IV pilus assembly protein PilM [Pirellulales bacterium]|nr:type IV pilus assembly protein PilM [Pirellulales bacterium]
MAGTSAVWGIDVGQCSLKAIRCRPGDTSGQLIAEAFDFIAYPKILSQPGAEPAELIRDALKLFLSRNTVQGCRVAISVPGQNGLARFIKLPPVESKKIPDIVRYEARQQIPFDLADVIWDFQQMGGGAEEEGFALETEVGLFAMKRDQVHRALEPFNDVGIEVDVVQLTPLALYNFLLFDQMQQLPPADQYDPDDPPPSSVILSLGTDATDLVVTNGYRVWQRSIPLGGNHFTKALTKELKLTFAKAEHLKCNAASAPDPRALFQAMRPVFNDLLTEIQRSIGYFTSVDRNATIKKIVALGNAMKMPGLRRYLSQSLGVEVIRIDSFEQLVGPEIVGAPAFKENLLSFGVAYGLAVQSLELGRGTLKTNLLPPEILKDRFVRGKKPWALAGVSMLLLGCAIGYASSSLALNAVSEDKFGDAERDMASVIRDSEDLKRKEVEAQEAFDNTHKIGEHLVGNVDNRVLWLELLRAVNECLPSDPPDKRPEDIHARNELHIESMESWQVEDLSAEWFANVKQFYQPPQGKEQSVPATDTAANASATSGGPTGPGWVIELKGYHYHNPEATAGGVRGGQYVRDTLIRNIEENSIGLPAIGRKTTVGDQGEPQKEFVSMEELGICYPVLVHESPIEVVNIEDPNADEDDPAKSNMPAMADGFGGPAGPVLGGNAKKKNTIPVRRVQFIVQFCWQKTPPTVRLQKKKDNSATTSDGAGTY